jgi:hypothetical protein
VPCEVGRPLRAFEQSALGGPQTQWDVAAGLALRNAN